MCKCPWKKEKIFTYSAIIILSVIVFILKQEINIARNQCKRNQFCSSDQTKNTPKPQQVQPNEIKVNTGKPNFQYEQTRRRLRHTLRAFSFLFETEAKNLLIATKNKKIACGALLSNYVEVVTRLKVLYKDFKNSMYNDFTTLKKKDGYDKWRLEEFNALSKKVQKRFHRMQSPSDCSKAKKIICRIHSQCGFGCELHHLVDCMMSAYFTGRTFTLDSKYWHYKKGIGWDGAFEPVSPTCVDAIKYQIQTLSLWPGSSTKNIEYEYCHIAGGHRPFGVPNLPHDIYSRITYIHDNPHIWWVGQFLKYLLRYQPNTKNLVAQMSSTLNLQEPIVGLHVRRNDKKSEAPFRPFSSYMDLVEEFYQYQTKSRSNEKRKVFLTTDDPNVVRGARKNYSSYDFITDPMIAQLKPVNDYDESNFNQTIFNLHVLARMPMVACTLTSNLCRLALELSASLHPDETFTYYSLDAIYMWPFGKAFYVIAHIAHTPSNVYEINIEIGDIIHQADIRFNYITLIESTGYIYGLNLRTRKYGKFPAFKVKLKPTKIENPNFNDGEYLMDK